MLWTMRITGGQARGIPLTTGKGKHIRPATDRMREAVFSSLGNRVEGARILEEGIALRPCDIDIVYINGYGFPEVTGGPMFWADQQGLDNVLADIKRFGEIYGGDAWKPAPLLEKLVAEGKGFASLQG